MERLTLKYALKKLKHRLILKFSHRKNRVYTQFFRFPSQHQALIKKIIPKYLEPSILKNPVEIVVFACCTGAEVYSLAYMLSTQFPEIKFHIRAYDIVDEVIVQARQRSFSKEEVYSSPFVKEEYVENLFDQVGETYTVKDKYAKNITFNKGDMLNSSFMSSLGKVDLVFAQNVLFHLPIPLAEKAFGNLVSLLKPDATLCINGMDTDMRIKLSKKYKLQPLNYLIEEIHNDARIDHGKAWAGIYFGREPFETSSKEWVRKYCTIFNRIEI